MVEIVCKTLVYCLDVQYSFLCYVVYFFRFGSWVHFVQKMVPDLPFKLTTPWTHQIHFACTCLPKLPQMHKFCVPFWHIWFHFWQYIDELADRHTDWHMLWLWCPKFSLFCCPLINLSFCLPHLLKDLLLFYFVHANHCWIAYWSLLDVFINFYLCDLFSHLVVNFHNVYSILCSIFFFGNMLLCWRSVFQSTTEWWDSDGLGDPSLYVCPLFTGLALQEHDANFPFPIWCCLCSSSFLCPVPSCIQVALHWPLLPLHPPDVQVLHTDERRGCEAACKAVGSYTNPWDSLLASWSHLL